MMAADRKKPEKGRPDIWASGGQRPPFDIRALGRASLYLSREVVAPVHAWAARRMRRVAVNVKNGAGRIPAERLGRAERFVPSHLRVAGWVKNMAATLSHASATADPDVKRGNALVAEIQPHLWGEADAAPPVSPTATTEMPDEVGPVVLAEPPEVQQPDDDPLASIRDEIASGPETPRATRPKAPDLPPPPPGPAAEGAIQVIGYLIGWASLIAALPYGFGRSLWLWISGKDLRQIGAED